MICHFCGRPRTAKNTTLVVDARGAFAEVCRDCRRAYSNGFRAHKRLTRLGIATVRLMGVRLSRQIERMLAA